MASEAISATKNMVLDSHEVVYLTCSDCTVTLTALEQDNTRLATPTQALMQL